MTDLQEHSEVPMPIWDSASLKNVHRAENKRLRIQAMFDAIAPTYEKVNALCSAGCDAGWRERAVRAARIRPMDRVLDVACGTGDLSRAFARAGPARVIGCDFAFEMVRRAAERAGPEEQYCFADGLNLPFLNGSFDLIGCAFGIRNFQDLGRGLTEMHRVLAVGGRIVILEFTRPSFLPYRLAYEFYSNQVMPWLAAWLSRDRVGAYRYLPASIQTFLTASQVCSRLRDVGFIDVTAEPLSFGAVSLYFGYRGN